MLHSANPSCFSAATNFWSPLDLGCAALVRGGQQKGWRELPGQILYRALEGTQQVKRG